MNTTQVLGKLGGKIRELRLKKNMTQNDLAAQCNFDKASMSRIESGKTNITILTLMKIGVALDVDITEFFRNSKLDRT